MNEKKSRFLLFTLGISIGLIAGASITYFSMPKHTSTGVVSENMIEQIVNKVYGLISIKKEVQDSLVIGREAMLSAEKSKQKISSKDKKEESPVELDSLASSTKINETTIDSFPTDSSVSLLASLPVNDDIVVRKDELVISKSVELLNMDFSATKTTSISDSLLPIISGIRDNNKMNEAKYLYQVEIWKSPINYKGYKLSKNKLILFGMDEHAPLKLFYLSDRTYLKCAEQFYKLESNADFKAFEKVANPMVAVSK